MRSSSFFLFLLLCSLAVKAQTVCGTVLEGGSLTLTAPGSQVFISVSFASYGTPDGACGSFVLGGCHAASSQSIVEAALLGNNSATISATNGVFGDPCGGTFKRLYVEAVYGTPLPLRMLSFSGTVQGNANLLRWTTTDEVNVKQFVVERSKDGRIFFPVAAVPARQAAGTNQYSYVDESLAAGVFFYRLKAQDLDGKVAISNILKLSGQRNIPFGVFPNPVADLMTVNGLTGKGVLQLFRAEGTLVKQINVTAQTEMLNMSSFPKGMYVLKYTVEGETTVQKVVKQ